MNVATHIERGAREYPDREALVFEGHSITYRECAAEAANAAGAFATAGVGVGDRVALFLPNVPEFVTAYLGTLKLGAIAVSINSGLKRDEVAFIMQDCCPKVIVTTPDLREQVPLDAASRVFTIEADFEAALHAADARLIAKPMEGGDPAVIVYTSGTTGQPKGATLSHANVVRNMEAKRRYIGIRPEDRGLLFMPLYHCFGQNAVLNAFLHAGATVVLHPRFDFEHVMASVAEDRITMFFGVPTTYILLLNRVSPSEMACVRYYFSAAARLPLEIELQWARKFGAPIFQGYGLTETSPFASYNHLEHYLPGSIGTPIEGVEMKIVVPDEAIPGKGHDAALGEKGEIVIRGHNVMLGYWNRPADTATVIKDGWFHTGDIGSMDPDGYFFITDRLTDLIISGGVNIYPAEIENVLAAHPAVAEAAVYGIPELLLGEQVCADIVLKPGYEVTEAEVRAFCRERLAPVKVPTVVRFTTEIPKGPTGKILKRVLRERADSGRRVVGRANAGQRVISPGKDDIKRWILAWLETNLGLTAPRDSDVSTAFADLGMNSILSVHMANELGAWIGRKIDTTAAWSFPSVEAMAEHLVSRNSSECEAVCQCVPGPPITRLSEEAAEDLLLAELEKLNR